MIYVNCSALSHIAKLYYNGKFLECIESVQNEKETHPDHVRYLALSYLRLGDSEEFNKNIDRWFHHLENPNRKDSVRYLAYKSEYYHYIMRQNKSGSYADQAISKLHGCRECYDDDYLLTEIFMICGNTYRNGKKINGKSIHEFPVNYTNYRYNNCFYYLDSALMFANRFTKPEVYRRYGTALLDITNMFINRKGKDDAVVSKLYNESIECYKKAIEISAFQSSPSVVRCRSYMLMGLLNMYMGFYSEAEKNALNAIDESKTGDQTFYPFWKSVSTSYLGWNYVSWYYESNRPEYLLKAHDLYLEHVNEWITYLEKKTVDYSGFIDEYKVSMIQKIPLVCYLLYQETVDEKYIEEALFYSDYNKYGSYWFMENQKPFATLDKIQNVLNADEGFLVEISAVYPNFNGFILVTKKDVEFVEKNKQPFVNAKGFIKNIQSFDLEYFKKSIYPIYVKQFKRIDQMLTQKDIHNLIVVPNNKTSLLSYEALLTDTLGDTWQALNFVGEKYCISYALNASLFVKHRNMETSSESTLGIINFNFSERSDLLFTKKLNTRLNEHYQAKSYMLNNHDDFYKGIKKHDIVIIEGHGEADMNDEQSKIFTSDSLFIDDQVIADLELNNSLVITLACRSDQTENYFSEGLSGGFTKNLLLSGVQSSIATLWDIDDQSNFHIMKHFFKFLDNGLTKNEALWLAKKEYWNTVEQDEGFHPLYWAGYKLTGNIEPLQLKSHPSVNNTSSSMIYLVVFFLLVVLIIVFRVLILKLL